MLRQTMHATGRGALFLRELICPNNREKRTAFESNGEQLAQTASDNGRNGSVCAR